MKRRGKGGGFTRCCAWALSLGFGLRRGREALRGHDGRLGPARVRRQGRKRRRWRGPQAKPRTRAPQRPLTGEAPAEARQAAEAHAQAARRWRAAPPERTRSTGEQEEQADPARPVRRASQGRQAKRGGDGLTSRSPGGKRSAQRRRREASTPCAAKKSAPSRRTAHRGHQRQVSSPPAPPSPANDRACPARRTRTPACPRSAR